MPTNAASTTAAVSCVTNDPTYGDSIVTALVVSWQAAWEKPWVPTGMAF
jgi:hypothetical protein